MNQVRQASVVPNGVKCLKDAKSGPRKRNTRAYLPGGNVFSRINPTSTCADEDVLMSTVNLPRLVVSPDHLPESDTCSFPAPSRPWKAPLWAGSGAFFHGHPSLRSADVLCSLIPTDRNSTPMTVPPRSETWRSRHTRHIEFSAGGT